MSPAKHRKLTPRQEASAADTSAERLEELAQEPKMARLVAANPNAPAELLLELSHSDDKAVRKACTSNANTPVEALLKLGAQFPVQLLENPVFDLLLLAHPGLFEELPTSTLNSLLKRDQVPAELIRWAWKHGGDSTDYSLLMNPNIPADVLEDMCRVKDPEFRIAAELHCQHASPAWMDTVRNWSDLSSLDIFYEQLKVERFDKEFYLLVLADHAGGIGSRFLAATDRWCSHGEDQYSSALVSEPGAPEYLLLQIIEDARGRSSRFGETTYLEQIIRCRRCSLDVLKRALLVASRSKDLRLLECAAECPVCPPNILREIAVRDNARMSKQDRDSLQTSLAANPNCPSDVLSALAGSEFEDARVYVYLHPSTLDNTKKQLLDTDPLIGEKASARMKSDREISLFHYSYRHKVTCWQAQNGSRGSRSLSQRKLQHYTDKLFHSEFDVRRAAALSLQRHADLTYLPFQLEMEKAQLIIAKKTRSSDSASIKKWCLASDICPTSALVKNFRSRDWIDRFIISQHSNTPGQILTSLTADGNQLVRRTAAENLARRGSAANQNPS